MRTPSAPKPCRKRGARARRGAPPCAASGPECLLDSLPCGVFWKGPGGAYLGGNAAFAEAAGLKGPDEVAGKTDADLPQLREAAEAIRAMEQEVLRSGRPGGVSVPAGQGAGGARWYEISTSPLRDELGRVLGLSGVLEDVTERVRAEEARRESEERYHLLVEHSPEAIAVHDGERFAFVNPAAVRLFGARSPEDLLNKPILSFVHPDFRSAVRARVRRIRGKGAAVPPLEETFLRLDGSPFEVEVAGIPLVWEGKASVQVVIRDITERKGAERALRESEQRHRELVETSEDLICSHDLEGRILAANPSAARSLGLEPGEVVGRNLRDFLAPEVKGQFGEYAAALRGEGAARGLLKVVAKRGERRIWEYTTTLHAGASGEPVAGSISHDVTERLAAARALKASQSFLNTLLDAVPVPVFFKDAEGRYLGFNRAFEAFFGAAKDRMIGKTVFDLNPPELAAVYHAKDRDLFEKGGTQEYESPVKNARGEERRVVFHKALFGGEGGQPGGLIGAILDVTDRIRAEEALRESEKRYRAIFEGVAEGIYRSTPEGKVLMANPALVRMLGYESLGEVLQRDIEQVGYIDPAERSRYKEGMERDGAVRDFVSQWRRRDGAVIHVVENARAVRAGDGRIVAYEGTAKDITGRMRAEEALRQSEERVRRKLEAILSPDADLGDLELSDILDKDRVQRLMDSFYALTHIGIGVIDLRGNVLVGTGWQDICTKFHRVNKETCRLCVESDLELSSGVPPGTFKLYKCKNHMWDMATPIMLGDRHVGNIFLGQFLFKGEEADRELFRQQARLHGFEEGQYLAALDRVPRFTRETVEAAMSFYASLAGILGDMSYGNIRLARALEEKKRDQRLREALYQIARAAHTSGTLTGVFAEIHRAVRRVMPARNFFIALHDEEDGLIHFPYFADEKDAAPGPLPAGTGLTAFVLKTRRPLLADAAALERLRRDGAAIPEGSAAAIWLGVPLLLADRAIGVLAVQHYADPKAFGEREQRVLEFVASEVARVVVHLRAEEEVLHLKRLYEVLSRANEVIIRAKRPQEMFEGVCRIVEELGFYKLAWVAAPDASSGLLRPAASSEDPAGYLEKIRVSSDGSAEGRGPVGTAFQEGCTVTSRDIEHDPRMAPWRDAALSCGLKSLAAFPLRSGGRVAAVFAVYAAEKDRYFEAEVRLLEELAADMSYALDSMREEELRRKAEADLQLLGTAIEQASEVVVITDTQGIILYANPALEKISGYTREEVLGKNPRIQKSGLHDRAFYKRLWDTILAGETWSGQVVNRRKDGSLYTEESIISPVRDGTGAIVAFVSVKRDVTREMAMVKELDRVKNLETVGMIASGVAHEVRNPLFAITTIVAALEKNLSGESEYGEYLAHIKDQSERLNVLMNDLLNLGRPTNPQEFVPLDLRTLLQGCGELVSAAGADSASCIWNLGSRSVTVSGIAGRLQQVFMNLAQNAISFTPSGGRVRVRLREEAAEAVVTFRDEGPGIASDFQPRLFRPFQTTRKGGTGLGLAIVRQIVLAHGGRVEAANNDPPPGATFTVRLPIAPT